MSVLRKYENALTCSFENPQPLTMMPVVFPQKSKTILPVGKMSAKVTATTLMHTKTIASNNADRADRLRPMTPRGEKKWRNPI